MIALLRGTLVERAPDWLVVDVAGVGYRVSVSLRTADGLPAPGQRVQLHTTFHVREDAVALYGFADTVERDLFEVLLGVSQIGPRVALSVLSTFSPGEFHGAVATEDVDLLTRIPGIGAKTARRLILELRDRLADSPVAAAVAGTPEAEAIAALMGLGYSVGEATSAVRFAAGQLPPEAAVEDLVRAGLGRLYAASTPGRG